ncbi:MAG: SulP family inorganic anion transporter [Cyclobacteriaceae bacterium]|nr:SulP family inorganic anion transporter [Cyclobacteriaceae bacterium]
MNFRNFWSTDFPSSVVVFLVALPLCLGIALASGAPLFSGLMAGIVGGIVIGSLSGSSLSVSGPAAGLTSIVLVAIKDLGTFEIFLFSVVVAGALQVILGLVRAGSIGHFFPVAVIKGMLAGIGLILILKQIPHAVGYDADFEGDESFFQQDGRNTFSEIIESLNYISPGAVIISLISVLILVSWNSNFLLRFRFFRIVPAPLIVVVVGIALNAIYKIISPDLVIGAQHLVSLPSYAESGLSAFFTFPDFSGWQNPKVYTTAITLAVVASLETLLSIEASDKMDPARRSTPLNRELQAQGIGNAVSGLLGGLPVTSVIVRSSANVNAGARTKASAISHGFILLLSVALIPQLLELIPLSCLAGILLVTGYKLTKPSAFVEMFRKGYAQFLPFVATVVAVLFTNLLLGVFLGIIVALIFILITNFKKAMILVSDEERYLIKFTKDVTFLNKAALRQELATIPENALLVIDATQAGFVDGDIVETLVDFTETARSKNISIEIKGLKLPDKALV